MARLSTPPNLCILNDYSEEPDPITDMRPSAHRQKFFYATENKGKATETPGWVKGSIQLIC